jgi:nucleoside-diphosphate-sugar epimerase
MPILVTGASGFIGRHLTARLLERGTPVRVVTRHPERLPAEWAGRVEIVAGSLTDKATLESATKGSSLVFHLAGEIQDLAVMQAVNADAACELVKAAGAACAKRFIHLSSVGVIGADEAGPITEDAPCRPKNEYERTKLEGERAVLEFARATGFDAVVVRPTTVFGEGVSRSRDSLLEWMRAVQQGRFAFIGRKAVANYVYVGDVVEAILKLSERPFPGGELFHIADPAPVRDFVWAMADALGVPCPTRMVPTWAACVVAAGMEAANRMIGTPAPLTLSRVRALSSACRFSGDKLRTRAGVTLPFGYRTGLARTVNWYRAEGKL